MVCIPRTNNSPQRGASLHLEMQFAPKFRKRWKAVPIGNYDRLWNTPIPVKSRAFASTGPARSTYTRFESSLTISG